MSVLEIRRHSVRKNGGGSQLSKEGVELARRLGSEMGPYDVVAASVSPRSRETAIAMGFAVDHELLTLTAGEGVYTATEDSRWWLAEHPFAELARVIAGDQDYHHYAHAVAELWRDLLTPLGEDATALVIGHSGSLEAGLVAALPRADRASWGGPFGHCEGARLTFEQGRFTTAELIRLG
ncbi:histidine phosphatase family protein [Flindersiella endophytica]